MQYGRGVGFFNSGVMAAPAPATLETVESEETSEINGDFEDTAGEKVDQAKQGETKKSNDEVFKITYKGESITFKNYEPSSIDYTSIPSPATVGGGGFKANQNLEENVVLQQHSHHKQHHNLNPPRQEVHLVRTADNENNIPSNISGNVDDIIVERQFESENENENESVIPSIFIINLDRATDRWAKSQRAMSHAGLRSHQFSRLPAVDGRTLTAEELRNQSTKLATYLQPRGVIGCYLSHRKFWQLVVDRKLPRAIVFEDDILLVDGFKEKLLRNLHNLNILSNDSHATNKKNVVIGDRGVDGINDGKGKDTVGINTATVTVNSSAGHVEGRVQEEDTSEVETEVVEEVEDKEEEEDEDFDVVFLGAIGKLLPHCTYKHI